MNYIGDRSVSEIQASDLTGYMVWLLTEYKPVRFNGSKEPLSVKSIRNVWVTFRSFFGWLHVEFNYTNPAIEITAQKFQKYPVETFTREDIEEILKACVFSGNRKLRREKSSSYLGKVVRKAVWRYLVGREDRDDPRAPLFISHADLPFNNGVYRI